MKNNEIKYLKDYLSNSIVNPEAKEELLGYVNDAFYRILYTSRLIPDVNTKGRLLEIGANPYFLTLLIKKFKSYDISLINYFGDNCEIDTQVIETTKYKEKHIFNFKNINVEKEKLPYSDESFDIVLFCEIIEHLTENPIFVLYNIYRVLKKKGILILSTPNVYRYENIKKNLFDRKRSIYDPYSAYGIYGRHNREYSLFEIEDILEKTGFKILSKKTLYSKEKKGIASKMFSTVIESTNTGNYIIIKAVKEDYFNWYFPEYLFRGAPTKIIEDDYIKMGKNCYMHIDEGWHGLEFWKEVGHIRWTKKLSMLFLMPEGLERKFYIRFYSAQNNFKFTIIIFQNNERIIEKEYIAKNGWQELSIALNLKSKNTVRTEILIDKTWIPKELGSSEDMRELGIAIKEIGLIE